MKPFNIINGLMLGFVFGSAGLAILASGLMDRTGNPQTGTPVFARLIRSEKKTFFGFDHYYFTCLLRDGPREYRLIEGVGSDLYHLKREGDNVEAVLFPGGQMRLLGNAQGTKPLSERPVLWLSVPLALVGILMALISMKGNPRTVQDPSPGSGMDFRSLPRKKVNE